jgi:hypothetical protein
VALGSATVLCNRTGELEKPGCGGRGATGLIEAAVRLLRTRPEFWFAATAALSAVTSFTAAGTALLGPAVIRRLSGMTPDPILPFTLAAALVSAIVVWRALARRSTLSGARRLLVAISVCIGPVGAFEIPFQLIRGYVFPSLAGGEVGAGTWLALSSWVLVGLTGLALMRFSWRFVGLGMATVLGFLAWWAVGFPQVTFGSPTQVAVAYLFNVPLKFAAFALFALPLVEGLRGLTSGGPAIRTDSDAQRPV